MSKSLKEMQAGYKPFGEHIMDEFSLFHDHLKKQCEEVRIFNMVLTIHIFHFFSRTLILRDETFLTLHL